MSVDQKSRKVGGYFTVFFFPRVLKRKKKTALEIRVFFHHSSVCFSVPLDFFYKKNSQSYIVILIFRYLEKASEISDKKAFISIENL